MGFTNFHSHSLFCDGSGHPEDFIKKAIELKMTSFGFSSHAPVPFECSWTMKTEDLPNYLKTIDDLKNKYNNLQIYKGLEVDYMPGKCGPGSDLIKNAGLDYVIGGIHFIDSFDDGTPWDIDGAHSIFEKGLKDIFDNNIQTVVRRYFQLIKDMISYEKPDILAHFDKIKTQNPDEKYYKNDDDWYLEEIDKTLDVTKQNNTIIEVNTKGVYSGAFPELYPNEQILGMILEKNIPVTISMDSHTPSNITNGFDFAAKNLKKIGFKSITALVNNKWSEFEFDEQGIKI